MVDMEILERMDGFHGLFRLRPDLFDVFLLDLPYPFDRRGGTTARCQDWFPAFNGWEGEDWEDAYDDPTLEENEQDRFWAWFHALMHEVVRTSKEGSYLLIFTTEENISRLKEEMGSFDDVVYRRAWIWDKERMGMGYYGRVQHEFILVYTMGKPKQYVQGHGTIFNSRRKDSDFPTEKPVGLFKEILELVTEEESRVCDPTCGSGPVLKAAKDLERGYCGFDIWEKAIEETRKKLDQSTLGSFIS